MNSELTLPWNRDLFTADTISLTACKHSRLPVCAFLAFALSPQQRRGVERRGCSRPHAARKERNRRALKGVLRVSRTKHGAAARIHGRAKRWMGEWVLGRLGGGGGFSCITSHSLHGSPWFTVWHKVVRQGHSRAVIKYKRFFKQFEILNCSRIAELALER